MPAAGHRLPLLIYLHGFLSSPQSEKATEVGDYINSRQLPLDYCVPAVHDNPLLAQVQLLTLLRQQCGKRLVALMGSSMGGYYASALANRFGLRAVAINPAVAIVPLLQQYLGEHTNPYSGRRFVLTQADLLALRAWQQPLVYPQRQLLLVQTGDETLDYRLALDYYAGAAQVVEQGGNHRFVNFDRHISALLGFLGLPN